MAKLTQAQELAILKKSLNALEARVHALEMQKFHAEWNARLEKNIKRAKD